MTMNTSEQILVVVLAVVLAILLVLSIAIAIMVLRLLKSINRITQKAEHLIESAEHVSDVFRNAAGPLAVFRVVQNIADLVSKHKSGKSRKS